MLTCSIQFPLALGAMMACDGPSSSEWPLALHLPFLNVTTKQHCHFCGGICLLECHIQLVLGVLLPLSPILACRTQLASLALSLLLLHVTFIHEGGRSQQPCHALAVCC